MSAIIKGSLAPFLQEQGWDYDPQRGYVYHATYRGASQAQMLNLQQAYAIQGIACRLVYNQGDTATLYVDDATGANTIDVWQLLGNEEQVDTWSHPNVLAEVSDDQMAIIRGYLEDNQQASVAFSDPLLSSLAGTDIPDRYARFQRGSTEFRRGQYVLRHTTNVPNRWSVNVADFGVDRIYTTAQLLSECGNASLWVYPLPARLAYKISNIPVPYPVAYYLWGWLKGASTETTAANNRIEISTEYTLYQWSVDDYTPY